MTAQPQLAVAALALLFEEAMQRVYVFGKLKLPDDALAYDEVMRTVSKLLCEDFRAIAKRAVELGILDGDDPPEPPILSVAFAELQNGRP